MVRDQIIMKEKMKHLPSYRLSNLMENVFKMHSLKYANMKWHLATSPPSPKYLKLSHSLKHTVLSAPLPIIQYQALFGGSMNRQMVEHSSIGRANGREDLWESYRSVHLLPSSLYIISCSVSLNFNLKRKLSIYFPQPLLVDFTQASKKWANERFQQAGNEPHFAF